MAQAKIIPRGHTIPMPGHTTRALLALLLALPLRAQTIRVTGSLSPAYGAPALSGMAAPAALAPLSAPQLSAASLTPALSAPMAPVLPAPVSLSALEVTVPAAAADYRPAGGTDGARSPARAATPLDGWASRFNFQPAANFFDGGRTVKSDVGVVFTAVPREAGTIRLHIVERAALAAPRPVPGTEGLSGRDLLEALHDVSGRGHKERSYGEASDFMFSSADGIVVNGVRGVIDAYSGIFVPGTSKEGSDYPERGDPNGDGYSDSKGMNVEHTWPQSLFNKALPMRSDLHHLMATFMHPNSIRGHLPFGEVRGRADYENKAGAKRGGGVFEPPDAVKGRVARGLLYFYSRYKDSRTFGRSATVFWNQQIELMLKWNREFPPDAFEARRNDLVESWQGNRNPFIDDYRLADRVGADALRAGNPSRGLKSSGVKRSGKRSGRRSSRR